MKKTFLFLFSALAGALSSNFAYAADELWLTRAKSGLDLAGHSARDRLEIRPDLRVIWDTASLGQLLPGGCAPGGGRFTGRISAEEATLLGRLALAAANSLKKVPTGGSDPAAPHLHEIRHSLEVMLGSSSWAGPINRATPESVALDRELEKLHPRLSPSAAVSIRVRREKAGRIVVRFVAPGADDIALFLPERAQDAFSLTGHSVRYLNPGKDRRVVMGPSRRTLEVEFLATALTEKSPSEIPLLTYSTAAIRHHARDVPELFLCSELH